MKFQTLTLVVAGLVLAGCGGTGDVGSTTDPGSSDATRSSTPRARGKASQVSSSGMVITFGEAKDFPQQGSTVKVAFTSTTEFRDDINRISKAAFLANAGVIREVEAEGSFSAATNTLTASRAKLRNFVVGGQQQQQANVYGIASELNATAKTFKVTVKRSATGVPGVGAFITVSTANTSRFRLRDGSVVSASQWYAAMTNGRPVEAEGIWNGTVLNASGVKIED